jgi:hypothetical protein
MSVLSNIPLRRFHQTITTKITFSAYFYYLTNGRGMSSQRTKYLTESVKDAGLETGVAVIRVCRGMRSQQFEGELLVLNSWF